MDENGDGKLELQEVISHYRLIMRELAHFFSEGCGGKEMHGKAKTRIQRQKDSVFSKIENKIQQENEKKKLKVLKNEKKGQPVVDGLNTYAKLNAREV